MAACRARAFRQQTVLDEGAGVLTASARPIFTRRDGVNVLPNCRCGRLEADQGQFPQAHSSCARSHRCNAENPTGNHPSSNSAS